MEPTKSDVLNRDSWYRELEIDCLDGKVEHFYIEMTGTGTVIPEMQAEPGEWTKLEFHTCPGCPLTGLTRYCPAALALESTLLRFRDHFSYSPVKATSVDRAGRRTSVEGSLQEVGSVFVQLAVFSSGCPVGKHFRPMLRDLRPFATNDELGRHLISKGLLKHRGSVSKAKKEIIDGLEPLHVVFSHQMKRLADTAKGDAVPNSLVRMDAFTMNISLQIDDVFDSMKQELGWDSDEASDEFEKPVLKPGPWQRIVKAFNSLLGR